MSALVLSPDEAGPDENIGGKATSLSALVAGGFDVPDFVTLPPSAFDDHGLKAEALSALDSRFARLGDGPFAVRSSGGEEDGAAASHAGQFLTVLDVARADVPAAAMKVWLSGAAASVKTYRASKGLEATAAPPAVIVQRMARARSAGVAFSVDPLSNNRDHAVISAVAGLADRLVSGEIDGDHYLVSKPDGRVLQQPDVGVLSPDDIVALTRLVVAVEAYFACPQDIEWAFEGEHLRLLQARPITTLRDPPVADETTTIFDNANIVESYPGLVTPLTYSFAVTVYARVYRMFTRLVGVSETTIAANAEVFENMLGRVDGRVYYNLVSWYRALALLPGFSLNSAFMETMMGVDEPLPPELVAKIRPAPARGFDLMLEYARVARVGARLGWRAFRLRRTVDAFYRRLNATLRVRATAIKAMPLTALAGEYRRIEAELLDRWDAPLINDFLCMFAFGGSRKLLQRWAGEDGLQAHNQIMIGQGDIVSAEPARRIRRMGEMIAGDEALIIRLKAADRSALDSHPALASQVAAYLDKFSDRCAEELKLESVPLDLDPTALLVSIAAAAQTVAPKSAPKIDGEAVLSAMFKARPIRGFVAKHFVGWARDRVRDRENLRFERTRIFGHARKVFLAIGEQMKARGLLSEGRDVLYLTVQEVLGAIEGAGLSANLAGLAALRKAEMVAAAKLPAPPARLVFRGAVAADARSFAAIRPAEASTSERRGTACSRGVVRARAKVIRDPRAESLDRGDILVARHTDPGWIAVFTNASAIVVERGSLLSHSAIVARELGIPCVVGVKGVVEWVVDGETLEVDGGAGIVRKIDG